MKIRFIVGWKDSNNFLAGVGLETYIVTCLLAVITTRKGWLNPNMTEKLLAGSVNLRGTNNNLAFHANSLIKASRPFMKTAKP